MKDERELPDLEIGVVSRDAGKAPVSVVWPASYYPGLKLLEYELNVGQRLVDLAAKWQVANNANDLTIRRLEAEDLGLKDWCVGPLVADIWRPFLSQPLSNRAIIAIYGTFNATYPAFVNEVLLGVGAAMGSICARLDLSPLFGKKGAVGILAKPVFFPRNEIIRVKVKAPVGIVEERFGLLGLIAEPTGVSVSWLTQDQ